MSAAGAQSARSNWSPASDSSRARRCVASSNSRFIRSCKSIKSCKGFQCCDITCDPPLDYWHRAVAVSSRSSRNFSLKFHFVPTGSYLYGLPRQDLTSQELHCQRILDKGLDRALEWTRPITRIVSLARQKFPGSSVQDEHKVSFLQRLAQPFQLHIDNLRNLLARQLMEDNDVVNAIEKFRFEVQAQFLQHSSANLFFIAFRGLDFA